MTSVLLSDTCSLVSDLNNELRSSGFTEPELITYWNQYAVSNRYDSKEVVYFKRILQLSVFSSG